MANNSNYQVVHEGNGYKVVTGRTVHVVRARDQVPATNRGVHAASVNAAATARQHGLREAATHYVQQARTWRNRMALQVVPQ